MSSIAIPLTAQGPFITAFIGVSSARFAALSAQGLPMPSLVMCRLLIDTGASNTNICHSAIKQLQIAATGSIAVHTPSTGDKPVPMDQYDVNLLIPMQQLQVTGNAAAPPNVHTIQNLPVIAADFKSQGMQGLLGRDVLQMASFSYHGHMNLCSLSF